ncbi:MAG: ribosomal L7Ae/L30e/S12e/Gadd45 family protein [Oscillospiraceae bacterium]
MKNKILSLIALCKKAGKLVQGFDVAAEAVATGKAAGVFLSEDLSPKSKRSITFICEENGIIPQTMPVTMDELAFYIRKRVGILVVTDDGLAKKISTLIAMDNEKEDLIE